jgi:hypothetical protein
VRAGEEEARRRGVARHRCLLPPTRRAGGRLGLRRDVGGRYRDLVGLHRDRAIDIKLGTSALIQPTARHNTSMIAQRKPNVQHMSAGVEPSAEEALLGGRETRALAAEDAVQW